MTRCKHKVIHTRNFRNPTGKATAHNLLSRNLSLILDMRHFPPLADCNDEKYEVISDLKHRDDRKAATESEPTTCKDTLHDSGEKSQIWKVTVGNSQIWKGTVGKSHKYEKSQIWKDTVQWGKATYEKTQWGKAAHLLIQRKRFLSSSGPWSSSGSTGPSGKPDSRNQCLMYKV